ncbi:MAG: transcriptional regulator [Candidatus Pelagibacter sp.]|nr:transcriptional regulator [Candidatus Pelagibacter sp.]
MKNISLQQINIIDNSDLHSKHKSFDKNKKHLKIIIKSSYLSSLSRIVSHKMIMDILKDDLKNRIHALEIEIL